jgi:hypothetical protein
MAEKKKMKDIDIKTKILGFAMLPIALVLWMIDRLIHVMMPHAVHPTFKAYLMKSGNIKYTLVRIIVFSIPVITYKLLF